MRKKVIKKASKPRPKKPIKKRSAGSGQFGFAMMHARTKKIVLASVRGERLLTKRLAELWAVNGGYKIVEVKVLPL